MATGYRQIIAQRGDTLQSIAKRELGDEKLYTQLSTADAGGIREGSVIRVPSSPINQQVAPIPPTPVSPQTAQAPTTTTTAPIGSKATPITTAPSPEEFAKMNETKTTTGPQTQPTQPTQPTVTTPIQGPQPAATPITVPNNTIIAPSGTGVKYPQRVGMTGQPQYQGGDKTRDIFNELKAGTRQPNIYSQDVAEQEANQIFQSYGRYANQNTSGLIEAIAKGELTPDPNNLLWTSLYQNGKPTSAQVEAYAKWDMWTKQTGGGKRESNPFLGGKFNELSSLSQANTDLNKAQEELLKKGSVPAAPSVEANTGPDSVTITPSQRADYEKMLSEQYAKYLDAANQKRPMSQYQEKLQGFIDKYGVNSLEDQLTMLETRINSENDYLQKQRNFVMNDPNQSLSAAAGNLSQNERNANERISQLTTQKQTLIDQLQSRYKIIEMLGQAYGLDYKSAVDNFDTEFARQKDFITSLSGQVQNERNYEKIVKDDAQANLNTLYNAFTSGGLDASALTPEQKLLMKKLEAQAGVPQGMYEALMVKNPKANILGVPTARVDKDGNRYYDQVTFDKETGEPKVYSVFAGSDYTAQVKNDLTVATTGLTDQKKKELIEKINMMPDEQKREWAKILGYTTDASGNVVDTLAGRTEKNRNTIAQGNLEVAQAREKAYESRINRLNNGGGDEKVPADVKFKQQVVNQRIIANQQAANSLSEPPYDYDKDIAPLQDEIDSYLSKKKNNSVTAGKSVYTPTISGTGSVTINAPITTVNGRPQLESGRRQCGEYTNDAIGRPGYFGNSVASKESKVTTQLPTPGSAFILSNNQYGHVGVVEDTRMNKDGKLELLISESNYDGKESFRRIWTSLDSLIKRKLVGFTNSFYPSATTKKVEQNATSKNPFSNL